MRIETNASLKNFNTFGIECLADQLIHIEEKEDLAILFREGKFSSSELLILGGGSNLLLTRKRLETVILIEIEGLEIISSDENNTWLRVGAGETWDDAVQYAVSHHWGGLENLSIIPGKAGAAPMQNIGAYGSELAEVFEELTTFNRLTGDFQKFNKAQCEFGYRNSYFKNEGKGKYIITDITLRLYNHPTLNTSYGTVEETLNDMGFYNPTLENVREAIIRIRNSKLPDPKVIGNSGSFFKNPVIEKNVFENIKERYPLLPGYEQPENTIKIPAAWLIENCNWKGKKEGNVGVHEKQALVIVNLGDADGIEILEFSKKIQESVESKFGILLEPEVNVV